MIKPSSQFPGQSNGPTVQYPLGSARDDLEAGDQTGTPFLAVLLNCNFGFGQAALAEAGLTASGLPDNAQDSDLLDALKIIMLNIAHPVGDVFITSQAGNPAAILGGGIWSKIEAQTVIGQKDGDPLFGTVNAVGGSISHEHANTLAVAGHTLDISEIPAHSHSANADGGSTSSSGPNFRQETDSTTTIETESTGGGGAHAHGISGSITAANALPPYVVKYIWERTA